MALKGHSQAEIARALDCHPDTVSRDMGSRIVKSALRRAKRRADDAVKRAIQKMKDAAPHAVTVLQGIMDDTSNTAADRIRAAQELLKRGGASEEVTRTEDMTAGEQASKSDEELHARALELIAGGKSE
jgi:DNA-directed RNA polymerase specialized sigma24 family protein